MCNLCIDSKEQQKQKHITQHSSFTPMNKKNPLILFMNQSNKRQLLKDYKRFIKQLISKMAPFAK